MPLPDSLTAGARITAAITQLLARGFAEERETSDVAAVHRTDGDLRFGVFATAAGVAAIGIGDSPGGAANLLTVTAAPPATSKKAAVIALLDRDTGATLPELIEATGWLPHTTRAALTGLRKAGQLIERSKRGDATCYRIVVSA